MDEAPSPRTVTLELYDDWPWTLHCPACGKAVLNEAVEEPCEHTVYIFHEEVGDTSFARPDLADALAADEATADLYEYFFERFDRVIAGLDTASMLHMVLHVSGMACGPVTTVHRFGFELAPPEPAEA